MNIKFINERKKTLGLTNQMMADKTGITLSTLEKITSGTNVNPKLSTIKAIARVLECKLDDFDDNESGDASVLSSNEIAYVERYRVLDEHGKAVVNAVLDLEYKRCIAAAPETPKSPEDMPTAGEELARQEKIPAAHPDLALGE